MTDLIDRVGGVDETRPQLLVEQFIAGFKLYALGLKTKLQASQDWDLQGQEQVQANALADELDSRVGFAAKLQYLETIHAVFALIESPNDTIYHNQDGSINKALVQSDLGF